MKVKRRGLDVSKCQGKIDWKRVSQSQYDFVMIKVGYVLWNGKTILDPYFKANIEGALASGLGVGIYIYSYANTIERVHAEADFVLKSIKPYKQKINFPVVIDIENKRDQGGVSKGVLSDIALTFGKRMVEEGYTPALYASTSWLKTHFDIGRLGNMPIWLADYRSKPGWNGKFFMWQHSSKGRIGGIKRNVDLNELYENPKINKIVEGEYEMAVLKKGSKGSAVKALQENLNELGFNCGKADGIFGNGTKKALSAFQHEEGLTADGIYGKQSDGAMKEALEEHRAPKVETKTVEPSRTLKYNRLSHMKGNDVKWVQERLKTWGLGSICGTPDGDFGKRTKNAVNEFQRGMGLYPDGVVGVATATALGKTEYWLDKYAPTSLWKCLCQQRGYNFCNGHEADIAWSIRVLFIRIMEELNVKPEDMIITSGNRCPKYNPLVGGAKGSQHKYYRAFDLKVKGYSVAQVNEVALKLNPYGGNGLRGNTITHCDTRGRKSTWYYNK